MSILKAGAGAVAGWAVLRKLNPNHEERSDRLKQIPLDRPKHWKLWSLAVGLGFGVVKGKRGAVAGAVLMALALARGSLHKGGGEAAEAKPA